MPTSDFTIGSPDGAQWLISFMASDGVTRITYRCRVNGFVFVRALQERLAAEPASASFDGNRYSGDMVAADGKWGPVTSRVLWSAVRRLGGSPDLLTLIAYEAGWRGAAPRATPSLGIGSLKAAIWLLHQGPVSNVAGGVPLEAIVLPPDTAPPVWGRAGAIPTGISLPGITCELLDYADPDAATPPAPPVTAPPGAIPASDPSPTPQPPTQDVTDDINRPSGLSVGRNGSQVPWGVVLGLGAVVVAIAWSTSSLDKMPGARSSKSNRRKR